MQVKRYGIEFDYNKQKWRIIWWYIVNFIVVFLLAMSLFLNINDISKTSGSQILIYLDVHSFQFVVTPTAVGIYTAIIFRIHERFEIINNLLK